MIRLLLAFVLLVLFVVPSSAAPPQKQPDGSYLLTIEPPLAKSPGCCCDSCSCRLCDCGLECRCEPFDCECAKTAPQIVVQVVVRRGKMIVTLGSLGNGNARKATISIVFP